VQGAPTESGAPHTPFSQRFDAQNTADAQVAPLALGTAHTAFKQRPLAHSSPAVQGASLGRPATHTPWHTPEAHSVFSPHASPLAFAEPHTPAMQWPEQQFAELAQAAPLSPAFPKVALPPPAPPRPSTPASPGEPSPPPAPAPTDAPGPPPLPPAPWVGTHEHPSSANSMATTSGNPMKDTLYSGEIGCLSKVMAEERRSREETYGAEVQVVAPHCVTHCMTHVEPKHARSLPQSADTTQGALGGASVSGGNNGGAA
jgi:hypothetical protein